MNWEWRDEDPHGLFISNYVVLGWSPIWESPPWHKNGTFVSMRVEDKSHMFRVW